MDMSGMFNHKGGENSIMSQRKGGVMKIAGTILFLLVLSMPVMAAAEKTPTAQDRGVIDVAELRLLLNLLGKEVTAELNKMDQDVAKLAKKLSERDFTTSEKRKMLGDLCRSYPYAANCTVIDRNGRIALAGPEKLRDFEGSDISSQEHVIRLRDSKKPVLSKAFKAVEGFEAVTLLHPIFSQQGEFAGAVSMLIRPESMLSNVITPVLGEAPVEALVMQTDGRILYDKDKEEIGLMLFEDPMYKPFPQLLAVGTMICKEKTGAGSYDFRQGGSEKMVKKDAHWYTVGLHGTEWRLVIMHIRPGQAVSSWKDIGYVNSRKLYCK
jgi:hypothetical protein